MSNFDELIFKRVYANSDMNTFKVKCFELGLEWDEELRRIITQAINEDNEE